jgi:hypothetical protein
MMGLLAKAASGSAAVSCSAVGLESCRRAIKNTAMCVRSAVLIQGAAARLSPTSADYYHTPLDPVADAGVADLAPR